MTIISNSKQYLGHSKYRADIDGLRAIAVLIVVGFHAFPRYFKGGFIGVDVFFVISGFLISTIILKNLQSNSFSFIKFYSRRIRRIFPALLVVLVAVYIFGWFVLMADEYRQLGKHIAAGSGFVSNLVMWNESNYFDNVALTKPLLHLWSLGIEEQFYIVWPLLLWLAWKKGLNLLIITVLIAATSFLLNVREINIDGVGAFYSIQTRFWELLVGSSLAYIAINKQNQLSKIYYNINIFLNRLVYARQNETNTNTLRNVQSFLGAILIVFGVLTITKDKLFPGWWALIPTLGALLIISGSEKSWFNHKVLSNRILVWFGLISYPLYLWHWPLLSFARISEGGMPSRNIRISIVLISIILAWITYKYIEKPLRISKITKTKILTLVIFLLVIGSIGYNTFKKDGYKNRKVALLTEDLSTAGTDWDYEATSFDNGEISKLNILKGTSSNSILFFGDSLMGVYYPRVKEIYENIQNPPFYSTVFAARDHCTPLPYTNYISGPENINCNDYYLAALKMAKKKKYHKIVLTGLWDAKLHLNNPHKYLEKQVEDFYEVANKNIDKLIKDLKKLKNSGKKIILISTAPISSMLNPHNIAKSYRPTSVFFFSSKINNNQFIQRDTIEKKQTLLYLNRVASEVGATLINPYDFLCSDNKCPIFKNKKAIYRDSYHMRASYVKEYGTFIDTIFKKE